MSTFLKRFKTAATGRGAVSAAITALIIAVVVLFNAAIYTVQKINNWYLYKPEAEKIAISDTASVLLANKLDAGERIEIIFCMSKDEVKNHDTGSLVLQTAELLVEAYPEIFTLDFYNVITKRNQEGERVDLSRYTTDENGEQKNLSKHAVIFSTADGFRMLSTADYADFYTINSAGEATAYNGEETMLSAALRALTPEHKTAYFTIYHGEIADPAFHSLLSAAGYDVDVIDLRREDIPEDAGLVVISAPQSDFERGAGIKTEIERLTEYVEEGGDLFVSLDPYLSTPLPVLENFLAGYGIAPMREEGSSATSIVKDVSAGITADGFTLVTEIANEAVANAVSAHDNRGVLISRVGALTLDESLGAKPLLQASASSVTEASGATVDRAGSYAVAAYCERGEGALVVVPSIYLTASDAIVTNAYSNRNFLYALFSELYGSDYAMPYGCRIMTFETAMLENLQMGTARLYTAVLLLIPAVLAGVGTVVLVRRKNR